MNICYIVGAGDFAYPFVPKENDLVIAADGGYDHLSVRGIRCDLLIGDLDSVITPHENVKTIRHSVEKDDTDMYLALKKGLEMGYTEFRIYGAGGGRCDHTFANYSLLLYAKENGANARIVTSDFLISLIKDEKVSIYGNAGSTFSVFAFGGDATGVDIKGAKYETDNTALKMNFPLGVSNLFLEGAVDVSVKSGALLIMQEI